MPEYLAPGVYVEEVDTGSKPIEGVSTSTAGMLGVTERGPVNVPILVTSYGEYVRWFGEQLRPDLYFNGNDRHCYLPHTVEGFFTNGGKRVYITRILDVTKAEHAKTLLYGEGIAPTSRTQLLRGATVGSSGIYVASVAGFAATNSIRIGDGSGAEYGEIAVLPATANDVALRLPLTLSHPAATPVDLLLAPAAGPPFNLAADAKAGDIEIRLTSVGTLVADDVLQFGTLAGGNDEYVFVAAVNGATNVVTLKTKLALPHPTSDPVHQVTFGPPVALPNLPRQLAPVGGEASVGDTVILMNDRTGFTPAGAFLQIHDAVPDRIEIRRIGQLGELTLNVPTYSEYAAGTRVEKVTRSDTGAAMDLTADAAAGSNVISVSNRTTPAKGDVIRIGVSAAAEFIVIADLPNPLPAPNAGKIFLSTPLRLAHLQAAGLVREQSMTTPQQATVVALTATSGVARIVVSGSNGFANGDTIRVTTAQGATLFHTLTDPPATLTAGPITLTKPLKRPHASGAPVIAREPMITVEALDAGQWGNRLRVGVEVQDPPLLMTMIRQRVDATHIRLTASNGVEPGTELRVTDVTSAETLLKVRSIDRQDDYLITLESSTPLPAASAVNDPVRSHEYKLNVMLLRQPDPANPARNETPIDRESFQYLTLDHRHSRYFERIIGATWQHQIIGVTDDDAGMPLRRSDRRSEGESVYIRVKDKLAPAATEVQRPGPEAVYDTLPDGRKRLVLWPLDGGDDAISQVFDMTYIGNDDPEPEKRTGLHALRNVEEISIVSTPGRTSPTIQNALINHCELMRYRFAVLDGPRPPQDTLSDVQTQRQQFDTKYAALYHPWLLIPDPFPSNLAQVADYPIPSSGHILGIYARTDIERGVHKAPANEVVRGIIGLQRLLNKEQQDILNPYPVNINVIRDFRDNNRGIRVYGGRCITSDSDWKYVNVRRLLIFIEASIDRGLQWVVFEPNAEPLWARVRRSISNFLTLVWRNGGLEGTKVEEAYFVKCDRTTMTQTDIDSGRLIVVVGVAPVKPAEFVIIRIGLWTAHTEE
jgi:phage tail sheath protein FI